MPVLCDAGSLWVRVLGATWLTNGCTWVGLGSCKLIFVPGLGVILL